MDPSQVQADSSNDSHSLEQQTEGSAKAAKEKEQAAEGDDKPKNDAGDTPNVTDATGGGPGIPQAPPKKSPLKKIWEKFNIYLLLFLLVIVLAVGVLIVSIAKAKQNNAANNATKSQGLTQDDLKQLATTDVTVGNPKQVLTVQANAVFSGGVLVRSNLEVAGSLRVGGSLSLSDLSVSGITQLGDTQVNNLNVAGALNLTGALNIKNGLSVSGSTNFSGSLTATAITTGSLQLNGDLNLTHHITAGGTIPGISKGSAVGGGGTVSLSGSDTAGSITINTGGSPPAGCFATITFSQKFSSTPHVVVTPVNSGAAGLDFYITRSTAGFVLCSTNAAPGGETFGFDYMAFD